MDNNKNDDLFNSEKLIEPINVSIDSINDMNIIINDSDCSDTFFNEICSFLSSHDLKFDITRNCVDIDEDDCTIITLDQQYNSGFGSLIYAPFNNTRLGYSDSLALAMKAAMEQNKIVVDDIISGRVGFRRDEEGNVSTIIPTEAEEKIDSDRSTSFVTISLGTQNLDPAIVAESIINALMRQRYYLDNFDANTDLLYRADSGEQVSIVADYFGASDQELLEFNKLKNGETLEAHTIINPDVKNIDAFNSSIVFNTGINKGRSI